MEYLVGLSAMLMVVAALVPQVVDMSRSIMTRRPKMITVKPVAPVVPVVHQHGAGSFDQDDLDHPWFR